MLKMLRFNDIVYGPIHSRRLGSSLGVNLLPHGGKICNFDCIYCECGWNSDGRGDRTLPTYLEVKTAMEAKLQECAKNFTQVDSITFSGHGEPTLHPDFAAIVDMTLAMRDRYCPEAKVTTLSNATTLDRPEVFAALCRLDNPVLKIDGSSDEVLRLINRPVSPSYSLASQIQRLSAFGGNFILQTMMLRSDSHPALDPVNWVDGYIDLVRLLRPRSVMVYTLDRPSPEAGLHSLSRGYIAQLLKPLIDERYEINIYAE